MKTLAFALALTIAPLWAQKLDFNFDSLAKKAKVKQEINVESDLIEKLAGEIKIPLNAIHSVIVRHYEFEQPGEFSDSDLAGLRKQAADGGWTRFINIKDKDESTQIYSLRQDGELAGFLVIVTEAKELTVAYVAGSISLAQLQEVVQSSIQYDMKHLEQ